MFRPLSLRVFYWLSHRFFKLIPTGIRRSIAEGCIRSEAYEPARDALCFLLNLDTLIYKMAGTKSIEYDKGSHVKHRITKYHKFFASRIAPADRVLDIGCGKGEVAYKIAVKSASSVVGVDCNEQSIIFAQENYRHPKLKFIHDDATKFLPPEKFDVVILSNVLEHIEERNSFLQKINRQVQPKRYLIRVPMFNRDWRVPLKKELGLPYLLDDTHFTEYTQESFEKEMTSSGLSVVHLEICWSEIWAEAIPDV